MVRHPFLVRIFKGSNPFVPISIEITIFYFLKMSKQFFFYLLSFFIKISAFSVITVENPIHSVLFLVLVFLEVSLLLLSLEVEFLSFIFIVIYVGAIAILFLFVVMMIDIKLSNSKLSLNYLNYFSLFLLGGFLLLFSVPEFIFLLNNSIFVCKINPSLDFLKTYHNWIINIDNLNNLKCIGQCLYTHYFLHFLMAGFLLLIGMIGAIVLTLNTNFNSKNQLIFKQLSHQSFNSTFLITTL